MMPAISFDESHPRGWGGKSWGGGPDPFTGPPPAHADPAVLMPTLSTLREQEAWADAIWAGRLLDQTAADLVAWSLAHRPDPTAPLPVSQAEQAARDAQAEALFASWRA